MKSSRESKKKTTYVLDTTVLLYEPDLMYKLRDNVIVIPAVVIKEIDGLKRNRNENTAQAARHVARTLDLFGSYADLTDGVRLSTGGILKVSNEHIEIDALESPADNKILGTALLIKKVSGGKIVVLTTDTNMRTAARINKIKGEFYPFGVDYEAVTRYPIEAEPAFSTTAAPRTIKTYDHKVTPSKTGVGGAKAIKVFRVLFAVLIIYIGWVATAPYRLIYLSGIGVIVATYLLYKGIKLILKRIGRKNTHNDMIVDLDYSDPTVMWTSKRGNS
ncbi:MAG: PIN domain-containing protein [Dissulfurispiraceae bacterium]